MKCSLCGKKYEPSTPDQIYCTDCTDCIETVDELTNGKGDDEDE